MLLQMIAKIPKCNSYDFNFALILVGLNGASQILERKKTELLKFLKSHLIGLSFCFYFYMYIFFFLLNM